MAFENFDSEIILDESSLATPTLTLLEDTNILILAWTERQTHQISLAICAAAYQPHLQFGPKMTLDFRSAAGPAIAAGPENRMYLAWRGANGDAQIYFSSARHNPINHALNFSPPAGLNEFSFYGPALTTDPSRPGIIL